MWRTRVLKWIYSLQLFLRESTFYVTANHFIFKGDSCRLNKTLIAKSLQQRSSELFEYSANFHGLISKETIFRHKRWLITHFIPFFTFLLCCTTRVTCHNSPFFPPRNDFLSPNIFSHALPLPPTTSSTSTKKPPLLFPLFSAHSASFQIFTSPSPPPSPFLFLCPQETFFTPHLLPLNSPSPGCHNLVNKKVP